MRRLIILLAIAFSISAPCAAIENEPIAVVLSHAQISRPANLADLALIYRRKQLLWENGTRINPANLPQDNPLRRAFSLHVLGNLPEALAQYWNAMYFNGVSPPHILASEEAVLRFVSDTPGAIGYVSACKVDGRVKAIFWLLPDGSIATQPPAFKCHQN